MSYIQIELGGEMRGLKFNMFALEEYTKRLGRALDYALKNANGKPIEEIQIPQAVLVYACIYSGLVGNCFAKEIEQDFTFEDVTDWVEAAKNQDLEAACNVLSQTERYKENLKNLEGVISNLTQDTSKKKANRKPTKKSGS